MVLEEWNISKDNFGIYKDEVMVDLTLPLPSKVIRHGLMALKFAVDKPIELEAKYPMSGRDEKILVAMQKIAKIRSIRLRNNMLRIINGDVFSKERMHRFGMIEEDKCDRCDEVETRDHLLFYCRSTNKMWQLFASIYLKAVGRPFMFTEKNVLACGDNYNSLATTTIIAELTKTNVLYRPRYESEGELLTVIKGIIQREVNWSGSQKIKIQNSWQRWVQYLTLVDVDRGPGVSGNAVVQDLDQLPPAVHQEGDEDLEPATPMSIVDVSVRPPNPIPQPRVNGYRQNHRHSP
jgi:hypothetical protein